MSGFAYWVIEKRAFVSILPLLGDQVFTRLLLSAVFTVIVAGAVCAESSTTSNTYRIGPNDVVRVQVFGEEDLTVESKVSGDGTINFPLLGSVKLVGKTVQEVQDNLTARLAEGYVRSPRVTLFLVRYRNFYVSGEVRTPGGYPYEAGLTLQKAISMAGGFTDKAEVRNIVVTRLSGNQSETVTLGTEAPLLPDDIIAVRPTQKFFVTGEVARPGPYPYEDQLTVDKALSMAGGLSERADPGGIKVTRLKETGIETGMVPLQGMVLPNDLIVVEGQHRKVYVSGEVRTPGGYPFKEGLTVQKALAMAGGFTERADKLGINVTRVNGESVETILLDGDSHVLPDDLIVVATAKKFYVNGEVRAPGGFVFENGLTVHKAITLAGGFTDKAAKTSTKVLRKINGQEQSIEISLETQILAEDIIVVPQRFF